MSNARKLPKSKEDIQWEKEDKAILRAMQKGVDEAILEHKRSGNPICTLVDGKVKWIKPEDI